MPTFGFYFIQINFNVCFLNFRIVKKIHNHCKNTVEEKLSKIYHASERS